MSDQLVDLTYACAISPVHNSLISKITPKRMSEYILVPPVCLPSHQTKEMDGYIRLMTGYMNATGARWVSQVYRCSSELYAETFL